MKLARIQIGRIACALGLVTSLSGTLPLAAEEPDHGFPESCWTFHKLIPLLASNHRVIAPDLRGFGDSGVAEGHPHLDRGARLLPA